MASLSKHAWQTLALLLTVGLSWSCGRETGDDPSQATQTAANTAGTGLTTQPGQGTAGVEAKPDPSSSPAPAGNTASGAGRGSNSAMAGSTSASGSGRTEAGSGSLGAAGMRALPSPIPAGAGGAGASADAGGPAMPAADGGMAPLVPGYLHTQGARLLDAQNRPVRLAGVSWFGMETQNYAPYGLANRSLGSMLDQIKSLGFNVIRLPFCNQLFDPGSKPSIGGTQNAELAGLDGLQLLDKIVQAAGQRGLKIILDRHRPDSGAQSELWYTSRYSEQRWLDDWRMLATRYKTDATVIAADLHNEPRGMASWGDGNAATDWQLAAERAGNAIHEINPNWLIIVEGIEKVGSDFYWWGGNLIAAGPHPVTLKVPNRVVYSTHDYPASLYAQSWFTAADYPSNLPGVWSRYFGYLAEQDIAPVFVGEFGTKLQTESDKQWLRALVSYIGEHQLNWSFWCFNPNSDDTGGILQDDWMSVNQNKLTELKPILAPLIE